MDDVLRDKLYSAFAIYVHRKTDGGFAYELRDTDPMKLKELMTIFISECEAVLRDIYGLDEDKKEAADEESNT